MGALCPRCVGTRVRITLRAAHTTTLQHVCRGATQLLKLGVTSRVEYVKQQAFTATPYCGSLLTGKAEFYSNVDSRVSDTVSGNILRFYNKLSKSINVINSSQNFS